MVARLISALILCVFTLPAAARVSIPDPRGDSHGAGCVVYPSVSTMTPGMFDITNFTLRKSGNTVIMEIRMAAPPRILDAALFQDRRVRTFVPLIDVYIARGGKNGYKALLPGRGAKPALPWQRVVVITGMPETVAAHLTVVMGERMRSVCVPRNVSLRGRVIRAVMPASCVGKDPGHYSYLVGVLALRPMLGLRHKLADRPDLFDDPLVVPMAPKPGRCNTWTEEDCAIGTCTKPGLTPRFLDILAPKDVQAKALTPSRGVCMLPFTTVLDRVVGRSVPKTKGLPVRDIKSGVITLLLPPGFDKTGMKKGRIAGLYDKGGRLLTTVIVIDRMDSIVVLRPLHPVRARKGMEVRF